MKPIVFPHLIKIETNDPNAPKPCFSMGWTTDMQSDRFALFLPQGDHERFLRLCLTANDLWIQVSFAADRFQREILSRPVRCLVVSAIEFLLDHAVDKNWKFLRGSAKEELRLATLESLKSMNSELGWDNERKTPMQTETNKILNEKDEVVAVLFTVPLEYKVKVGDRFIRRSNGELHVVKSFDQNTVYFGGDESPYWPSEFKNLFRDFCREEDVDKEAIGQKPIIRSQTYYNLKSLLPKDML